MSEHSRDVSVRKGRHAGKRKRDPHMFTVIEKEEFSFWYGIHGADGEHARFAIGLDDAYIFLRRQLAKLELLYERRKRQLPEVPLDDIDEFVSDAVAGEESSYERQRIRSSKSPQA